MSAAKHVQAVGDILHRVDGEWIDEGSETYQVIELCWTTWRVVRLTPCGAWLQCVERHWKKQRFALASGARWVSKTREEALQSLIARKRRQLSILTQQETMARDTLAAAEAFNRPTAQWAGTLSPAVQAGTAQGETK